MPIGKRMPQTAAWRKMWIQRIESMGAWAATSERSSSCSCARAALSARRERTTMRRLWRPMAIIKIRIRIRREDDDGGRGLLLHRVISARPSPVHAQSCPPQWLASTVTLLIDALDLLFSQKSATIPTNLILDTEESGLSMRKRPNLCPYASRVVLRPANSLQRV
jgi:hypothetical protein